MRATVVIPTLNARGMLTETLEALEAQTAAHDVVVVDNASTDGTAELLAERFPQVRVVRLDENLGFGRAVNRGVELVETDVVVLVNNDVVCPPDFLEQLLRRWPTRASGWSPASSSSTTVPTSWIPPGSSSTRRSARGTRSGTGPVVELAGAPQPAGPCGGAAAYRTAVFRDAGGFDEAFFAYWEDVDLALRIRLAGHGCVRAPDARALHKHGQTLGAASPRQRELEAFGRAFVLARYRVARRSLMTRVKIAALDWPVLVVHLVIRRETGPLRERHRGRRVGAARPALRAPFELAGVSFVQSLSRQLNLLRLRATGSLPSHLDETEPARRKSGTPRERGPLVDEELRAQSTRQALGEPPRSRQGSMARPLDAPAARLEQRHEIAPRQPASGGCDRGGPTACSRRCRAR